MEMGERWARMVQHVARAARKGERVDWQLTTGKLQKPGMDEPELGLRVSRRVSFPVPALCRLAFLGIGFSEVWFFLVWGVEGAFQVAQLSKLSHRCLKPVDGKEGKAQDEELLRPVVCRAASC
jgi:hypothetical protein